MFTTYIKMGKGHFCSSTKAPVGRLESGVYDIFYDESCDTTHFIYQHTNSDKIVDLPGTAFDRVVSEISQFLLPATKALFADYGFLYKRSFLLHGKPGGGKTCIVNRVMQKTMDVDGLVLMVRDPRVLEKAFAVLSDLEPGRLVLVVIEEIDSLMKNFEKTLLLLLDGEVQMNNVIYLATTNHLDALPERLLRPGRFSSIVEVGWPTLEARIAYLSTKFKNEATVAEWAAVTDGLSIDEIKEVVLATMCIGHDRADVIAKIAHLKKATSDYAQYDTEHHRFSPLPKAVAKRTNRSEVVSWGGSSGESGL